MKSAIAIRHLHHRGSHDGRGLLYVVGNDALVGVEIGVVRRRIVFDGVLLHANAGQSGVVE